MAVARCSKERIRIRLSSYLATYLGSWLFIIYLSWLPKLAYLTYLAVLDTSCICPATFFLCFSISALLAARVALLTQEIARYIASYKLDGRLTSHTYPSYCVILCMLVKSRKKTFLLVIYQHNFESPYTVNFFVVFFPWFLMRFPSLIL